MGKNKCLQCAVISFLLLTAGNSLHAQPGNYYSQPQPVEIGRELPRTRTISYNSEAAARERSLGPSLYLQPLDGQWTRANGGDGVSVIHTHDFKVPFSWVDRRHFIYIGSAGGAYELYVNGKFAGYNQSGSSAAEFDVTPHTEEGLNKLEIRIWPDPAVSVLQNINDRRGELTGEVYAFSQPRVRIRDYSLRTSFSGTDAILELGVIVKSHMLNPKTVRIHFELTGPDGNRTATGYRDAAFEMRGEDTVRFLINVPAARRWSHETPDLYTLVLKTQHEGRYTEYISYNIGLRRADLREGKLRVNGYYPALSVSETDAAGDRAATASMLAGLKEGGVNTVKVKTGPQPGFFYELCDSIGLYVCDQADIDTGKSGPSRQKGGNPSNDPVWESSYADRALSMYHISGNHPSVVMFSLAGEGSSNGYNLYESYLAVKSREPLRPVIYTGAGGEWNTDAVTAALRQSDARAAADRMTFDIAADRSASTTLQSAELICVDAAQGIYRIENRSQVGVFHGELIYTVKQGMKKIGQGTFPVTVLPQSSQEIQIPSETAKPGKALKFEVSLNPVK